MANFNDTVRSTGGLYQRAFHDGIVGVATHWPWLVFPVAYTLILYTLIPFLAVFGSLGAGFIISIIQTMFLAHYMVGVASAVTKERVALAEHFSRAGKLFFLLLNSFFILWIVSFVVSFLVRTDPTLQWIASLVALVVLVLCNPVVEEAVLRGNSGMQGISASFEFVRENWWEWFLPQLLVLSPIFFLGSEFRFMDIAMFLIPTGVSPATVFNVGIAIGQLWSMSIGAPNLIMIALSLVFLLFGMIFRGSLFMQLSGSTRRKRAFQQRFGR